MLLKPYFEALAALLHPKAEFFRNL